MKKFNIPNNEGITKKIRITNFGMVCCTGCNKLFANRVPFPEKCPLCKANLDYSIFDELAANPIVIDESEGK